ncbi:MAG: FAD binding domain-containing protein [Ilumatobacteraceae bacterium]|nr:FAD binding domain-containing protein [Ilumatobacteraceae bacterium]
MPVLRPRSVDHLLELLADTPDVSVLAGGTDMMVEINLHGRRPGTVLPIGSLEELREWEHQRRAGTVTIGAAVPYADMETGELAELVPALAQAARTVGSPQIRAAGTIGGNLGTCSPAGDILPVLSALDAVIHVLHRDHSRDVHFSDFMTGVKRNSLRPGEFVHSVTVPVTRGWQGYAKVGTRNAMVISTASACLVHDAVEGHVALALGAVAPTIVRASRAEAWLSKQIDLRGSFSVSVETAQEFGRRAASETSPISDHRSTADYRRHAVSVLARRLLERSAA